MCSLPPPACRAKLANQRDTCSRLQVRRQLRHCSVRLSTTYLSCRFAHRSPCNVYLLIKVKAAMHTRHLSDQSSGIHPSPRLGPASSRDTTIRGCARALAGKKKEKKKAGADGTEGGSFVMVVLFPFYLMVPLFTIIQPQQFLTLHSVCIIGQQLTQ